MNDEESRTKKTGVEGLDDVLAGGLSQGHLFLLEGSPGTGKTTIALKFLLEGEKIGEQGLYITLSETEAELRASALSHGWQLGALAEVFELIPPESLLNADQQQSLLYSSDLELGETTRMIFEAVERVKPVRVVLDSLSEIRLLAQSSLRYRRQVLAMKHYFTRTGATVLVLDDLTSESLDKTVHSVAHGVIRLEQVTPNYGAERRRARIVKYRGRAYRGGYHDMTIATGGVSVFPRLVAAEYKTQHRRSRLASGITGLDSLLGGGVEQGTSALILGPAGSGKSTFSLQFVMAAIARGEKAAMFLFDEETSLLVERSKALGFDLEPCLDRGDLIIEQVDAAELSPGEFAFKVRQRLDIPQLRTLVVDSLNGYQAAMPDENSLVLHIHELLQYANRKGATTFLTVAQHGVVGDMKSPVDLTYLADTVVLLRYFEAYGRVRRAVSIIKKRPGAHEDTIREYRIGNSGISVGVPLSNFQGVLRGIPIYDGQPAPLLQDKE